MYDVVAIFQEEGDLFMDVKAMINGGIHAVKMLISGTELYVPVKAIGQNGEI